MVCLPESLVMQLHIQSTLLPGNCCPLPPNLWLLLVPAHAGSSHRVRGVTCNARLSKPRLAVLSLGGMISPACASGDMVHLPLPRQ